MREKKISPLRKCCKNQENQKYDNNRKIIKDAIWDYKSDFEQIDQDIKNKQTNDEDINPLINSKVVGSYINDSFEEAKHIKKRWNNIKKLRLIQEKIKPSDPYDPKFQSLGGKTIQENIDILKRSLRA